MKEIKETSAAWSGWKFGCVITFLLLLLSISIESVWLFAIPVVLILTITTDPVVKQDDRLIQSSLLVLCLVLNTQTF